MRDFKPEDFDGCGQYLIRNDKGPDQYSNASFMCTIMYKIGWLTNNLNIGNGEQILAKIAMSDGMLQISNYVDSEPTASRNWEKVIWQHISMEKRDGTQKFCNWLNNEALSQEYRLATHEELMRVMLNQTSRTR